MVGYTVACVTLLQGSRATTIKLVSHSSQLACHLTESAEWAGLVRQAVLRAESVRWLLRAFG
jgi:hypothetical protein